MVRAAGPHEQRRPKIVYGREKECGQRLDFSGVIATHLLEHQSKETLEIKILQARFDLSEVKRANRRSSTRKGAFSQRREKSPRTKHDSNGKGSDAKANRRPILFAAPLLHRPEETPKGIKNTPNADHDQEKE